MTTTEAPTMTAPQTTEHFDVLIVGAGISGVGAAYHLTQQCPGKSFVVLEGLESFGGTWLSIGVGMTPTQEPGGVRATGLHFSLV